MESKSNIKVVIAGVNGRKTFDIVNIVQNCYGYQCILCAGQDRKVQLPLIYGQKIYRVRHTVYEEFSKDFNILLNEFKDTMLVYLPVSEKGTRLFLEYIKLNPSPYINYLLPEIDSFEMTSDKERFQNYCERNGFSMPRSFDKKDFTLLKNEFRPLILKPRSGEGSVGIKHFDLQEELDDLDQYDMQKYILQEKVQSTNKVSGAFFLCKDGKVTSNYTHQRLRTFPIEGGVTVYSKSTYETEIIEIGTQLLQKLNWNGLAMIEFMFDERTKSWKIIELNPRLWGSALLSAFNGSEMLDKYIKISCDLPFENKQSQTKPVFIRWLFPFDLINWLKGKVSTKDFFKFDIENTCFICFTYASWWRALTFLLYFSLNFGSIKRFIKK